MYELTGDRPLTPEQRRVETVMPWKLFAGKTREDLSAIYACLRQLEPSISRVQRFEPRSRSAY